MTLTLELTKDEEARLEIASRRHGTDPASYAKLLVTEHLPTIEPTAQAFEEMLGTTARALPIIPGDKQTREFVYDD